MLRWFADEKEERRAAAGKHVRTSPRAEGDAVKNASRPRGFKLTEGRIRPAGEAAKRERERELEAALLRKAAASHAEAVQRQYLEGWRAWALEIDHARWFGNLELVLCLLTVAVEKVECRKSFPSHATDPQPM